MKVLIIIGLLTVTGCKSVGFVHGGIERKESKDSGRGNGFSRDTAPTSTGGGSTGGGSTGGQGNGHGKDKNKGHGHGHDKHKDKGHDKDKHKGKDK